MKKLIYRGVTYEIDPTHQPIDDRFDYLRQPMTLKYRGNTYQLTPDRLGTELYQPRGSYELQYRGVKYSVHPNGQPAPVSERPRAKKQTQPSAQTAHQVAIERSLKHRIAIAREKGDLCLMAMLELERRQLMA
jgi:Domain of unknown function (DUF4278)